MTTINSWNTSWLNLIQEGTLEHLTDSYDYVFEELSNENEYMELKILFNNTSKCFRVMRAISKKNEKDQEIKDEDLKETKSTSSSIPFLTLNSFPDGIFLEITQSSVPIFHIVELKRNPVNHIKTISKQFLSAYIHCKFLNSILHFEKNATYRYYVAYNENVVNSSRKVIEINEEYNSKMKARRTVSGRPSYEIVSNWYKNNLIKFYGFEHKHTFDEVINIPLTANGLQKDALKKLKKLDVFTFSLSVD